MDDLIYILLGLVWIGLALYRNSQKKKLQRSRMEQQEKQQGEEEVSEVHKEDTLLEEILMGQTGATLFKDYEDDVFEGYKKAEKKPEPEPSESFEEEYEELGIDSVEDMDIKTAEKMFEALMEDQETLQIQHLEEEEKEPFEFDLRKAVIYSEILNSRYF